MDSTARTLRPAAFRQQGVGRLDVYRLRKGDASALMPRFLDSYWCRAVRGDILVSFSSLNEHNRARSGCWITRSRYVLRPHKHTFRTSSTHCGGRAGNSRFPLLGGAIRISRGRKAIIRAYADPLGIMVPIVKGIVPAAAATTIEVMWLHR